MPAPDYLALCPLCRKAVGLLSNRVRAALHMREVDAKLRRLLESDWVDGREPQTPEAILAKWVQAGLVIERVDGEAPEMEGHAENCVFGRTSASERGKLGAATRWAGRGIAHRRKDDAA